MNIPVWNTGKEFGVLVPVTRYQVPGISMGWCYCYIPREPCRMRLDPQHFSSLLKHDHEMYVVPGSWLPGTRYRYWVKYEQQLQYQSTTRTKPILRSARITASINVSFIKSVDRLNMLAQMVFCCTLDDDLFEKYEKRIQKRIRNDDSSFCSRIIFTIWFLFLQDCFSSFLSHLLSIHSSPSII